MTGESGQIIYEYCPVCSSPIERWRRKQVGNAIYTIDVCATCGFAFINPRPSMRFLMDYYSSLGHGQKGNGDNEDIPTIDTVRCQENNDPNSTIDAARMIREIKSMSTLHANKRFLDVGCGYGFFAKEALESGFDVIPLELAENERRIAEGMTGLAPRAVSFEEFDCTPSSLSVVLMSQILEHALDINLWVSKANALLADRGVLAIALPNYGSIFRLVMQEKEPYICPPAHLNFFNPHSLSRLLEKHGFEVLKVQWISRIPKNTFEKRLPGVARALLPAVHLLSRVPLKTLDVLHLGTIINVYGRKIGAAGVKPD